MRYRSAVFNDLNDLVLFVAIVDNGGFAAASRELGVSKSHLSKHLSQLEERLGVRLLQRTTRKFTVTASGRRFYRHCNNLITEAQAAQDTIDRERSEPSGQVVVSCPVALSRSILAPILPDFLAAYPQVEVKLLATNRRIDLIDEAVDIAIRVRNKPNADASFIIREFGQSRMILVANSALWQRHSHPQAPAALSALPTLTMNDQGRLPRWQLETPQGQQALIALSPRLVSDDFSVLLEAACRGTGVALLPESVCGKAIGDGCLKQLLPDWSGPQGIMHFVYPSRRGLLPGVRAMVDFLAIELPASQRLSLV